MELRVPESKLYNQKNIELLKSMESNSLDAIVTDCPYGLGKEPDAVETLQAWITTGYHEIKGKGFMGKEWDSFVPQPIFWKEVFRVLKPGGYVLAFFGSRTYDWGVMAIRLAGFEIRDCIQWVYGSGFPKSLDVSKALDKQAGAERESKGFVEPFGREGRSGKGGDWHNTGNGGLKLKEITAPSTEGAKHWEGYGTALKPAYEPICVARKPLAGTVADNVLKHDCGALNLDECRIPMNGESISVGFADSKRNGVNNMHEGWKRPWQDDKEYNANMIETSLDKSNDLGRFPANVIFDEEAAAVLDEQSGTLTSGSNCIRRQEGYFMEHGGLGRAGDIQITYGDTGGASRFFYCAKASKEDRNYGCEGLAVKDPATVTDFRPTLKSNPENWANGTETPYTRTTPKANNHPTVKPISLMRYLVRLVKTPFESCTIADFFLGSGTTGVACMLEGINFVGCDDDQNSYDISQARIEYAKNDYIKEQLKPKQAKLFEVVPENVIPIQSKLFA